MDCGEVRILQDMGVNGMPWIGVGAQLARRAVLLCSAHSCGDVRRRLSSPVWDQLCVVCSRVVNNVSVVCVFVCRGLVVLLHVLCAPVSVCVLMCSGKSDVLICASAILHGYACHPVLEFKIRITTMFSKTMPLWKIPRI